MVEALAHGLPPTAPTLWSEVPGQGLTTRYSTRPLPPGPPPPSSPPSPPPARCSEVTQGLSTLSQFERLETRTEGIFVMPKERITIFSTYV